MPPTHITLDARVFTETFEVLKNTETYLTRLITIAADKRQKAHEALLALPAWDNDDSEFIRQKFAYTRAELDEELLVNALDRVAVLIDEFDVRRRESPELRLIDGEVVE